MLTPADRMTLSAIVDLERRGTLGDDDDTVARQVAQHVTAMQQGLVQFPVLEETEAYALSAVAASERGELGELGSFFKKLKKKVKKYSDPRNAFKNLKSVVKKAGPAVAGAVATYYGGPQAGAAAYSVSKSLVATRKAKAGGSAEEQQAAYAEYVKASTQAGQTPMPLDMIAPEDSIGGVPTKYLYIGGAGVAVLVVLAIAMRHRK